jgi:hypothetical protein
MVADWDCIVRTLVRVEMAGQRRAGSGHDGFFRRFQADTPRGGWRTNSAIISATSGRAM